jgi:transcriptional regulator with XRE-family HTH domain
MNERIKQLRKDLGMTQATFADRILVSRSALAKIESGENNPSPQTIQLICQQFRVRKDWLLEGTGPMMLPEADDDAIIDEVLAGDDEFVKAVIRGIAKTPGGWEKMRDVFNAIASELQKNNPEA